MGSLSPSEYSTYRKNIISLAKNNVDSLYSFCIKSPYKCIHFHDEAKVGMDYREMTSHHYIYHLIIETRQTCIHIPFISIRGIPVQNVAISSCHMFVSDDHPNLVFLQLNIRLYGDFLLGEYEPTGCSLNIVFFP